jgi:hypothetical protein
MFFEQSIYRRIAEGKRKPWKAGRGTTFSQGF